MNEATTVAYLHLLSNPSIGSKVLSNLLLRFGSLHKLKQQTKQSLKKLGLSSEQCNILLNEEDSKQAQDTREISVALDWQGSSDQRIVLYESTDYPLLLKQIAVPPPLLFCHGDVSLLNEPSYAVVGSRNATSYGTRQASLIASELATLGFTIVSGLAKGIDAAAHNSVLKTTGRTIAVIGTGIDREYPRSNKQLFAKMKSDGLVITEFMPGMPPKAMNFPQRNRIISGISLGTIVIEASLRSGSLITARLALEQNRCVFAVPGAIDCELAEGCHKLIREGASLTRGPNDICNELLASWHFESYRQILTEQYVKKEKLTGSPAMTTLTQLETQILNSITESAMLIDTLIDTLKQTPESLLSTIMKLEMKGLIKSEAGRVCRIKDNWNHP